MLCLCLRPTNPRKSFTGGRSPAPGCLRAARPYLTAGCDVVNDGDGAETSALWSTARQRVLVFVKCLTTPRGVGAYLVAAAVWQPIGLSASVPATRKIPLQMGARHLLAATTSPNPCGALPRAGKSQIAYSSVCSIMGTPGMATVSQQQLGLRNRKR